LRTNKQPDLPEFGEVYRPFEGQIHENHSPCSPPVDVGLFAPSCRRAGGQPLAAEASVVWKESSMICRLITFALVVMLPALTTSAESLIAKKDGLYVLENALLRAEVKVTELERLTWKATGQELMTPNYHGVVYLDARAKHESTVHYLVQDSFVDNRRYEIETGEIKPGDEQATLKITFDWGWSALGGRRPYTVVERVTIFKKQPVLRVRYDITVRGKPTPVPGGISLCGGGVFATHLVEAYQGLRVQSLKDRRLSGMRTDPNDYWFALWHQPTGHFAAAMRPGRTNPMRCSITGRGKERGSWAVGVWSKDPFIAKPGQAVSEEIWLFAGKTDARDAGPIAAKAEAARAFINKQNPLRGEIRGEYVTHEQLVEKTRHLRADGKGDHIVFRDERLYVDGRPFLLFGPWGVMWPDLVPVYKKYHLTGMFGPHGYLDAAQKNGLMHVAATLEWPAYRGKELEAHVQRLKDHPALLAWFLQDDFGDNREMLDNIEIIRKYEKHIPTIVDTVGRDASRRSASAYIDLHAPYQYPVARRLDYRYYADYLDHNRKIMGHQFNWTCPETTNLTAAQIRLETIIGLAHGVRGFMYWPGPMLVDHRLSELGILRLEVEPLTELIVEADIIKKGASIDQEAIEAQRIDWGEHTLIFLTHIRDRSVRWVDGELAPTVTVTVPKRAEHQALSMTFDRDLNIDAVDNDGDDLKLTVSGLDVGAMIVLTSDQAFADECARQLEARRAKATRFARTTNAYMAWKVYEPLFQLARMKAPMGKALEAYHAGLAQMESAKTFTGQRRAARQLRIAIGRVVKQADELERWAPSQAAANIKQWYRYLPQFMASFNVRALRPTAEQQIKAPPPIEHMAPMSELPEPKSLAVGDVIGDRKSNKCEGFVSALKGGRSYAVYQTASRRFTLYPDRGSYERGQTANRAPLVFNEYVQLPGDFGPKRVYMIRPKQDRELYIIAARQRESLGLVTTEPLPLGSTITVNERKPIALYEVTGKAGDSFQVTVEPSERHIIDVKLCQGHPRHAQVLANARVASSQSLRCTLPDDGPMVVVITPHAGEGTYTLHAKRIEGKVTPQARDNSFHDVRFGILGKEPAPFTSHLAAGGISGERLDGRFAETE